MEEMIIFINALQEAVKANKKAFVCPICGGTVKWAKASGNGHVHCSCTGCGIRVAE